MFNKHYISISGDYAKTVELNLSSFQRNWIQKLKKNNKKTRAHAKSSTIFKSKSASGLQNGIFEDKVQYLPNRLIRYRSSTTDVVCPKHFNSTSKTKSKVSPLHSPIFTCWYIVICLVLEDIKDGNSYKM